MVVVEAAAGKWGGVVVDNGEEGGEGVGAGGCLSTSIGV